MSCVSELTSTVSFEPQFVHEELQSGLHVSKADSFNTSFPGDKAGLQVGLSRWGRQALQVGRGVAIMNVQEEWRDQGAVGEREWG